MQYKLINTLVLTFANYIACTPDGKRMVVNEVIDTDGACLCNDQKELLRFKVPPGHCARSPSTKPAMSADGNRVAVRINNTITVYNAVNGNDLKTFKGDFKFFALTHDGGQLVTVSQDKRLRVWNTTTGKQVKKIVTSKRCVRSMAITPDGKYAITGADDRTAKVWDLGTGDLVVSHQVPFGDVYAVAITPDAKRVAICSYLWVRIWDVDGQLTCLLKHSHALQHVELSPAGDLAFTLDTLINIWDANKGLLLTRINIDIWEWNSLAYAPLANRIIAIDTDDTLFTYVFWKDKEVWDILVQFVFHKDMSGLPLKRIAEFAGFSLKSTQLQL